uniref:Uncharacterized protein n=1 Tax=Rhizophora mucronata TaxID=61149 RepID=A0A2P2IHM9_RHIMU
MAATTSLARCPASLVPNWDDPGYRDHAGSGSSPMHRRDTDHPCGSHFDHSSSLPRGCELSGQKDPGGFQDA